MKDMLKILKEATDALQYLNSEDGKKFVADLDLKYLAVLNHRIIKLDDEMTISKVDIGIQFANRASIVDVQQLTHAQDDILMAIEDKVHVKPHNYSNYTFQKISNDLLERLEHAIKTFQKIVMAERTTGIGAYMPTYNEEVLMDLKDLAKTLASHQKHYYYYFETFEKKIGFIKKSDLPNDL
ncbi:hypothetical protein [Lactobacillus sp. Sy-1]|uniref:hypothetical protein n=1 Tax=Lactobacillus sp. Sy-1 TaxID=2109645 RepID=UPI001C5B8A75|nr:hypothetical protein [Lactobacillus sp. Sy-1]MBW1606063.1 hypothetical protein [Lactobacillus sp. Sy-1]